MKLTSNEASALADLWNSVKSYITAKDRQTAAEHFLSTVQDNGLCDLEESASEMYGVCSSLDKALREYDVQDEDYDLDEEWE